MREDARDEACYEIELRMRQTLQNKLGQLTSRSRTAFEVARVASDIRAVAEAEAAAESN